MIDFETGYMPDVKVSETPESNDLYLYSINTQQFHTRYLKPTVTNLARKIVKGVYQPELGLKAFENLAGMGAHLYNEEFGNGRTLRGFSKADRKACAVEMMEYCWDELDRKVQELKMSKTNPVKKQRNR